MDWITWTTSHFQYIAGAIYGLALLGSHASPHTVVARISNFLLKGRTPPGSN